MKKRLLLIFFMRCMLQDVTLCREAELTFLRMDKQGGIKVNPVKIYVPIQDIIDQSAPLGFRGELLVPHIRSAIELYASVPVSKQDNAYFVYGPQNYYVPRQVIVDIHKHRKDLEAIPLEGFLNNNIAGIIGDLSDVNFEKHVTAWSEQRKTQRAQKIAWGSITIRIPIKNKKIPEKPLLWRRLSIDVVYDEDTQNITMQELQQIIYHKTGIPVKKQRFIVNKDCVQDGKITIPFKDIVIGELRNDMQEYSDNCQDMVRIEFSKKGDWPISLSVPYYLKQEKVYLNDIRFALKLQLGEVEYAKIDIKFDPSIPVHDSYLLVKDLPDFISLVGEVSMKINEDLKGKKSTLTMN